MDDGIQLISDGEGLAVIGKQADATGIVGTYTDPGHVFAYDDGEVRQEFSIRLLGRPLGGELRVSDESHEVAWFTSAETDELPVVPSIRKRLAGRCSGAIPVVRWLVAVRAAVQGGGAPIGAPPPARLAPV
ncbi:hypothetical protein [Kitasatospora brasiliensis]|uniref:hypothetical protein n=1 Tax=Kitasatospora brasiliensis TaxID=3058040 RepID=UPI00292D8818|nr:hypothetical protein [Kitasatospora sp. K002]